FQKLSASPEGAHSLDGSMARVLNRLSACETEDLNHKKRLKPGGAMWTMAPWLAGVALRCYRELHEHIPLLAEEGWMRRQPAGWRRRRGGRTGDAFRYCAAKEQQQLRR